MFLETMKTYGEKWSVKESLQITKKEAEEITSARVESRHSEANGDFLVICLSLTSGGQKSMILSSKSKHGVGEVLDPNSLIIYTLSRPGDEDILRMDTI